MPAKSEVVRPSHFISLLPIHFHHYPIASFFPSKSSGASAGLGVQGLFSDEPPFGWRSVSAVGVMISTLCRSRDPVG